MEAVEDGGYQGFEARVEIIGRAMIFLRQRNYSV